MSTDEDLELRDLVTQALESKGVLSKIRAELRASVFLALDEQDLLQTDSSFANKEFKNFIRTSEGMLLTQLIREFLEFFELDFTLSVFDPETSYGKDYEYLGRNTLIKELEMKNINGERGPLLAQILKIACNRNEPDKELINSLKEDVDNLSIASTNNENIQKKNVKNSQNSIHIEDENKAFFDQPLSKLTEQSQKEQSNSNSIKHGVPPGETFLVTSRENDLTSKRTENKVRESEEDFSLGGAVQKGEKPLIDARNDLISLSNLPPILNSNKSKTDILTAISNSRRDINQVKTMMNSLDVTESNYEEDFQSSASGSCVEGQSGKNSLPGSETEEVEEDIGSGIDDLLSNASGLEDLTIDATVSSASCLGDYMENV